MINRKLELALELSLSDRSDLKTLILFANSLKEEIENQPIHGYSSIDRKIFECAEHIYKAASTLARQKFVSYETDSIVARAMISQSQLDLLDLALKESDKRAEDRQRFLDNLVTFKYLRKKIAEM